MPCFSPLHGWRSILKTALGKRAVVFRLQSGYRDMPVDVPCGQCIGCRLERSRQWAIRCLHESELHSENCFITLTFSDENLPSPASVAVRDLQLFFKKLRKRFNGKIRYFACGEYGEGLARPHYHAIVFGLDFPDKVFVKKSGEFNLYESPLLDAVWGKGLAWIGDFSFESAAYVARYVVKKQTGKAAVDHYHDSDGVVLSPEFIVMSRGGKDGEGGIGARWFEKYGKETYGEDSDFVVVRGIKMRPPKFYDGRLELADAEAYKALVLRRRIRANDPKVKAESTQQRLDVREEVVKSKQSLMSKRRFENDY